MDSPFIEEGYITSRYDQEPNIGQQLVLNSSHLERVLHLVALADAADAGAAVGAERAGAGVGGAAAALLLGRHAAVRRALAALAEAARRAHAHAARRHALAAAHQGRRVVGLPGDITGVHVKPFKRDTASLAGTGWVFSQ